MRVVILTRPTEDSKKLAEQLGDIPTLIAPLTEITHRNNVPLVVKPKAWLATSRHAIPHVSDELKKLPWFAVGEKTANAAIKAGIQAPEAVAETAELLAEILKTRSPKLASPLLYLSAEHTKFDFADALQDAKIDVIRSIVYEAETATALPLKLQALLKSGEPAIIAFYSARTARIFYELADKAGLAAEASDVIACCMSADVAENCAAGDVRVADAPTGEAMRSLLGETAPL